MQSVPVAISAFSADTLKKVNIENVNDIQLSIPSTMVVGGDTFTIRGIGNGSLGGDAGVGTFLNGSGISMVAQDQFFDLERIEVLRGPQGTLYGRNTTGGAVSVVTKRPTKNFGGEVSAEVGNFGEQRFVGAVNFAISDVLTQRFAGYIYKRDGFTKNLSTGNSIDGRDQTSIRSSTRLKIGSAGDLNLVIGQYSEDSSRTRETKRLCKSHPVLRCSPTETGFDSPSTSLFNALIGATGKASGGSIYAGAPNPADPRVVSADLDPTFTLDQTYATLEYTHDLDSHIISYVAGYSDSKTEQNTDWDNSDLAYRLTGPITYDMARNKSVTTDRIFSSDSFTATNHTTTHELRVNSQYDGAFNFTAGLFMLDQRSTVGFEAWHPAIEYGAKVFLVWPLSPKLGSSTPRAMVTKSEALFGEANYKVSDKLRVAVGGRYTSEDRTSQSRNIVLSAPAPYKLGESSVSKNTGRVTVDYAPDNNSLIYGYYATGYKGGGFNIGNATNPTFKPEEVSSYEAGWKNTLLNGTVQANLTAFYNDYKDYQLGQRIGGTVVTTNSNAVTKGIEAELNWAATRAVLLDANFSVLNTRLGSFSNVDATNPAQSLLVTTPVVAVNLTGNELPYAPKKKVKIGAQYTMPLFGTGWTSIARIDYSWQDTYFAREFNTVNDKIAAWGITNLQARFVSPDRKTQVKLYVKNLADKNNITRIVYEDFLVGNYRNARYLDPRTFGVAVEYKF
ncbi:MAG: TonB-dependent receptor [Rhodocyclaceae bacterium]|nr:TonB-dependent receptor [Rhodocyclaceae bacterium]